ncbi:MAG TPA: Rid family detoxifying hydrolase [Sedimentisphaerales bacterium]|nr:Rid family detoxifying hydrolase [Sedimentisphaerales bacterium]
MDVETILTKDAAGPVGPYSQGIVCGGFIFTSGQIPVGTDGKLVGDDIETQTEQVMRNLKAVLAAGGAGLQDVVKATVFLTDLSDFARFNAVYARHLGSHRPVRSTAEVTRLALGARVEIDVIAAKP